MFRWDSLNITSKRTRSTYNLSAIQLWLFSKQLTWKHKTIFQNSSSFSLNKNDRKKINLITQSYTFIAYKVCQVIHNNKNNDDRTQCKVNVIMININISGVWFVVYSHTHNTTVAIHLQYYCYPIHKLCMVTACTIILLLL